VNKRKASKIKTKLKLRVKPKRVKDPLLVVVCILSGKESEVKQSLLTKQAIKLKFDTLDSYVKFYICKECILSLREGFTEKAIREEHACTNKMQIPFNVLRLYVKKFKNRAKIEKLEKRKEMQEYLEQKGGSYIVKPRERQYIDMKSPGQVAELTKGACLRPDIYLNNGKACNGCHIYELCKCNARKWNDKLDKPVLPRKKTK
jgi:hypothetical protein